MLILGAGIAVLQKGLKLTRLNMKYMRNTVPEL
jgi:hypothetical protein